MTTGTTFVLVPGSFATPAEHDKLEELLTKAGHPVKHVALLTANDGSRLPPATGDDDAAEIRSAIIDILDKENHNVVLAVHSYSGIPGSSALKELGQKDRKAANKSTYVSGILYIAACLPDEGQSSRDLFPNMPEAYKVGFPGDYFPAIPDEFAPFIFTGLEPEEIQKRMKTFTRHASDSYSTKCTYAAWKYIPATTIIPTADAIIPAVEQERMFQHTVDSGAPVKRVVIERAGHVPNITHAQLVVTEALALAGLQ